MKKLPPLLVTAATLALLCLPAAARTFVMPHVLEKSGTVNNTQFTFDTTIFMTYAAGLPGVPPRGARGSSLVDVYLYNDDGSPMKSKTSQDVCNPCTYKLDATVRKLSIRIDDLIEAAGGFEAPDAVKTGYAIIIVKGDTRFVNLKGFVVNAHTGPFDLSVFGFDPQPIGAAP